jgi:hypothetical protein
MTPKLETDVNQPNKLFFWIKRVIAGIFLFWLIVYLLIWSLSPMIFHWQLNKTLEPLNLRLSDKASIRVNPFILKLSLSDIEITTNQSSQVLASIEAAVADIDALELFNQVIQFEQFGLSGATLDVHRTVNNVEIAGWQLNKQQIAEQPQTEQVSNTSNNENKWRVNADLINLQGLNFTIDNLGHTHQIEVKQLRLNAVNLSDKQQKLSLLVKVLIDESPLKVNADFMHSDAQGQLSINLELDSLGLEKVAYLAIPNLLYMSGNISSRIQARVKFDKQHVAVELPQLELNFKELAFGTSDFDIFVADSKTFVTDSTFEVIENNQPLMNINFSMDNSQFDVKIIATDDRLLGFDKFVLTSGNVSWSDTPLPIVAISSLQFEQLKFSQKDTKVLADTLPESSDINQPLVQFGKIDAQSLKFNEQHLSLNSLGLDELIAHIVLDKNKQLTGLVLPNTKPLADKQAELNLPLDKNNLTEVSSSSAKTAQEASTTFSLDHLNITGKSRLTFNDQSIQPNFGQSINLERVEIDSIDNRQLNNLTRFIIKLKMDAYSALNLEGKAQIFNDKLNLELNSSLNEFSLPAISPYLSNAMGFEMLSGQFDKKIQLSIIDNIIKGKAELNMRGMQLTSVDPGQGNTLKEQSTMPLNKALGLLMDDKGNLELSLPLSGDVSKPEFGVSSFIAIVTKKAVMSAAKNYLLDTFVPYANVLSVVMLAGDYMLTVSFEDLVYLPTATAIDENQAVFVTQFINLLKDKTETQIKVCAFATQADLPEQATKTQEPLSSDKYQQQLLDIALRRAESFKTWVVEKGGIQSSRLLLCKPRIDNSPKGKPRLEFEV